MNTAPADPRILPAITQRWSPRSFTAEIVPQADLDTILTAAGLAPSAFNLQPWTFLHARRGDGHWDRFLSLLVEFNQSWARDAGALVFIVSAEHSGEPRKPLYSHSFDAGAAWALLAVQATAMGWHAHAMTGVDFDRARAELAIPPGHRLEAAVAIGRRAPADRLPESLREREAPSPRKPLGEIAYAGNFPG